MATEETIEKINESVGKINKGLPSGVSRLPVIPTITPEDLSQESVPFEPAPTPTLPPVTPATFVDETQKETERVESNLAQSFEDQINAIIETPGLAELEAQEFEKAGVDKLKAVADRYDLEIAEEQKRLRREIQRIQEQGGGLKIGASSEIQNAERGSLAMQADLSLLRAFAQNDYQAAKATAERYAKALDAHNQKYLDALKESYEFNKDQFTTAQQNEFTVRFNEFQRQEQAKVDAAKTLQDTKLSAMQMAQINGAPHSVLDSIGRATTPEEVLQVSGQWGSVDMLERQYKRQQIASSRTNQLLALASAGDKDAIDELGFDPSQTPEKLDSTTKRQTEDSFKASSDLLRLATEYKTLIDTSGYTNEIFGDSTKIARINSLRAQMTAAYKDAKKLGTLDSGLLTLMDSILGDKPTSSIFGSGEEGNIFANITGRRQRRVSNQIGELIDQVQLENARDAYLLGIDPWSDPLGLDVLRKEAQSTVNESSTNPLGI